MKWFNVDPRRRARTRRARLSGSTPVVGGPYDGQRVREIATTPDGAWIRDRYYLCLPPERRVTRDSYPYQLRDGVYVWNQQGEPDARTE